MKPSKDNLAWQVRAAIMSLPDIPEAFTMIPAIFSNVKGKKADKADAFMALDSQPYHFGGEHAPRWHQLLRLCRNHPVHGRELFAVWS